MMLLSFTIVSCDSGGMLSSNVAIDNHAQEIVDFYASQNIDLDCVDIKGYLLKARNKVLQDSNLGLKVSNGSLTEYLIQEAKQNGDVPMEELSEQSQIEELANKLERLKYVSRTNTIEPALNYLQDKAEISGADKNFILGLETTLKSTSDQSPENTISILDSKINEVFTQTGISAEHQEALSGAMHITKALLCDGGYEYQNFGQEVIRGSSTSGTTVESRCDFIECLTTYEWTLAIVYVVVTILVLILAIFTFGLSLLLTSLIAVSTWTLSTIVVCELVSCDDEICPTGQSPSCAGSFTFDELTKSCTNDMFPTNAAYFDGCIISPRPITGICPTGSIGQGSNCLWECFFPIPANFGRNDDGIFRFDYECI